MSDRKLRVFLCHASQDKPIVRELYQRLLTEDWIDPWLDEERLLPGYDWDMEIEKAVEAADVVIVCLSNRSLSKEGYVQRELRFALDIALQKPEGTIFIIPLKLEECEPPRRLRTWQYVEYFPPDKRDKNFQLMKISMQERMKSLGLTVAINNLEISTSADSLSSRIISKKISDARQALQNDQLPLALAIYETLVKQSLGLEEIIRDLEDVSIIYSNSKDLWKILATAYRIIGNLSRAQEYEEKINPAHTQSPDGNNKPKVADFRKAEEHSLDNYQQDKEEDEIYEETVFRGSEVDQQPTSVNLFLPSTISIETLGGLSTPIFYKGDTLPAEYRSTFSTAIDNQSQVELHLVVGENKLAGDNNSLGRFILDGIPPAPKGVAQIEVTVTVSRELELNVIAIDRATGRRKNLQSINLDTITPPPIKEPLPPKSNNLSVGDLFSGNSDFSDLFQSLFGRRNEETADLKSLDKYHLLEISMEEAFRGATRVFQIDGKQKQVRIPAGVYRGSKVRVPGALANGLDLYLFISVQPHLFFTRTGSDLYMHYPISKTLAHSGGTLQVPLLERGKSFFIKLPPDTKDKQVIRFANRGFPNVKKPSEFGDLYLTVDLYDPQKIPPEFIKLLDDIKNHMR